MIHQADRVLQVLRDRGAEGTYQGEWYADAPDGRGPITRLTSRIDDLKNRGHKIGVRPKTKSRKFVTYYLIELAPAETRTPSPEPPGFDPDLERDAIIEAAHLFEPPPAPETESPAERYYQAGH